jgi:hypothetical protein
MAFINISKSESFRNDFKASDGLQVIVNLLYRPSTGNMQLQCLRLMTNLVISGRIRYVVKTNPGIMKAITALCDSPVMISYHFENVSE